MTRKSRQTPPDDALDTAAPVLKPRSFRATDADWDLIKMRAAEAGLSTAEFLIRRALEPGGGEERVGALPVALLRRFALDIRSLAISEQWRFEAESATADWRQITKEAARQIAGKPDTS